MSTVHAQPHLLGTVLRRTLSRPCTPTSPCPIAHHDFNGPQGEDPGYTWVLIVLSYWLRLFFGIISAILSVLWLLQVILYIFLSPPLDPFLNTVFKALDKVFPLFGTAAFAIFCFYLIGAHHIHPCV